MQSHLARCSLLAVLAAAAPAQIQVTLTPPGPYDLAPGQTQAVTADVKIPGESTLERVDVYIIADVTGSMGPVLSKVQAAATSVVQKILSFPGNIFIGIGQYRDFPGVAFTHQVSPTENQASLVGAIASWAASGGGDFDEGQLFALTKIATDPAIGFRQGAKRIVVWFGDAPGHDPICPAIDPSVPKTITEATVISDLRAAGPGGTTVIAISSPTGVPNALDADPKFQGSYYFDYLPYCTIGGTALQAQRITAATDGINLQLTDPDAIVRAILQSIQEVLFVVDVSLGFSDVTPGFAQFVTGVAPPLYPGVRVPRDPKQSVSVSFQVQLAGQACVEGRSEWLGQMQVLFDGAGTLSRTLMTIRQSACLTLGLLGLGDTGTSLQLPAWFPGGPDFLYTLPLLLVPVTPTRIPTVTIPVDPILLGQSLYSQVLVYDPVNYPADWLKTSNGLQITIGGAITPFGSSVDIKHWSPSVPELGRPLTWGFEVQ